MRTQSGRTEASGSHHSTGSAHVVRHRVWSTIALLSVLAGPTVASAQIVGRVHIVWDAQQARDNRDGVLVYVVDDTGLATRLQTDGDARLQEFQALDRRRVEVQGDVIVGEPKQTPIARSRGVRPLGGPFAAAESPGGDMLDFITVLCRFSDDPAEPLAPSRFERVVGPEYPGMQQYFAELSWTPGVMAGNRVTSIWYDLPEPRSSYVEGTRTSVDRLARDCTSAAEADVDFSLYFGVNLQFGGQLSVRDAAPYDVLSFGGSWTLTLDGETRVWGMTWLSIDHAENYVVYAHEMGHALGWPHSSGRYGEQYDSRWDVMSRGYLRYETPWRWLTVHTIGPYKDALGWIPSARRWEPAMAAVESGTLVRAAQPSAQGYLLAVMGPGADRFYTAETRAPTGHDVGIPGKAVVIHEVVLGRAYVVDVDLNGDPNDDGARWTTGETFTDSLMGLTLRVDAETVDGFDLTITRGWTLDVATSGEGEVETGAGSVDGLRCPSTLCSHLYPVRGTQVQLTARPMDGWALRGWTGACVGDRSCTVTMGSNRSVGAVFGRQLPESTILARLFDGTYDLSVDDLEFLDQLGNRNGRFDIGDVRGWLAYTTAQAASLPTPAPSTTRTIGRTP